MLVLCRAVFETVLVSEFSSSLLLLLFYFIVQRKASRIRIALSSRYSVIFR